MTTTSDMKLINSIENIGGIDGLLRISKLKIETIDTFNSRGLRVCRLMGTIHMDLLNQEAYSLCVRSFENDPDIVLELPSVNGGNISQALFIKELPSRFNHSPNNEGARGVPLKVFTTALTREFQAIKERIITEESKLTKSTNPFISSEIVKSIAKNRFVQKILSVSKSKEEHQEASI